MTQTLSKIILGTAVAFIAFALPGSIRNELDLKFEAEKYPNKRMAVVVSPAPWKQATASWYTMGDTTSDGTRMRIDGDWVATRLVPLGSKIEVRYQGKTRTFTVRDRPHKSNGHRLDFPQKTWQALTRAKLSTGIVRVDWRPVR